MEFENEKKKQLRILPRKRREKKHFASAGMQEQEAAADSGSDRENKPLAPPTAENNYNNYNALLAHNVKKEEEMKPKRKYSGWSVEEVDAFFHGVAIHGCDFERLSGLPVLNKTYEQVECSFLY